jgi:hypothetical protein
MININTTVDRDLLAAAQGSLDLGFVVDKHFDELYDHYTNNGEMPYGVAKARDGDPSDWIYDRLRQELNV